MPTITIEGAQSNLSELIAGLAPGEEILFTRGATPVARLTAGDPQHGLIHESSEAHLIQETKRCLPAATSKRLQQLVSKSENENLNPAELEEYQRLAQEAEAMNAARVLSLAELARRRGEPVSQVKRDIGWKDVEYGT